MATTTTPALDDTCDIVIADPPPPYPSRTRRSRTLRSSQRGEGRTSQHTQTSSGETHSSDGDAAARPSPYPYNEEDNAGATEYTPFLSHRHPNSRQQLHSQYGAAGRPRAHSYTSTTSAAPSLAHTVLSFFHGDDGEEEDSFGSVVEDVSLPAVGSDAVSASSSQRAGAAFFSRAAWRRYFRPLGIKAYYRSLFHLLVLNFPYGLIAWIYLFVFTVTGTTLLVALPLGAVLCFFDLLGARAFSRGELALQYRFHAPLSAHPAPHPPRPIFTRHRLPTTEELEAGSPRLTRGGYVKERSFYKNTYAMFTDSTSYQALFYFLVIKPAITLLISIGLIGLGVPAMLLVLPAPAVLRAVRKIGIWQANVAIEGLYVAVR